MNVRQDIGGFGSLPLVVKNILIINVLFFLATLSVGKTFGIDLSNILGLHYFSSESFKPYQLVTYMFMHGGFGHIFFNMFAVWMFGRVLEDVWGPKRFLIYYFVTGIGAALIQLTVTYFQITHLEYSMVADNINMVISDGHRALEEGKNFIDPQMSKLNLLINTPTIGASGAVFGILLAFGMLFPNTMLYVYFAIPVKAKYFVMIYGAIELYLGISNNEGDNVAHFAHLGGMIFGFFLIRYWKKKINRFY